MTDPVRLGPRDLLALGLTGLASARVPVVWLGDRWFTVVGIRAAAPLAPEVERSVLVGWQAARQWLGFDGHPTVVYVRAVEGRLEAVRRVLAATVFPENPARIEVSRQSEALAAKRITETTFSGLFPGLAGVALLVGGVGVASTMVVSILERLRQPRGRLDQGAAAPRPVTQPGGEGTRQDGAPARTIGV
ncbi:hypothetical protein JOF53_000473 [Crossiella equi]|uniref:Uncharacterized protein n=1 Tax=Crossiella equi TaxID=130796 RepID=A0ABS5A4U8_9PSEU|nr:hypothetical protein [Crossiella equi]